MSRSNPSTTTAPGVPPSGGPAGSWTVMLTPFTREQRLGLTSPFARGGR